MLGISATGWIVLGVLVVGLLLLARLGIRSATRQDWENHHCPKCETAYNFATDKKIVSNSPVSTVYEMTCSQCGHKVTQSQVYQTFPLINQLM